MLILYPKGVLFHTVVVFVLSFDFSFKLVSFIMCFEICFEIKIKFSCSLQNRKTTIFFLGKN